MNDLYLAAEIRRGKYRHVCGGVENPSADMWILWLFAQFIDQRQSCVKCPRCKYMQKIIETTQTDSGKVYRNHEK